MAVYKRGNSWTVQISWYITDPDAKSGKKKKYKTKTQAKKWKNEQILAKNKNNITNENPVFADFFGTGQRHIAYLVRLMLLKEDILAKLAS